MILVRSQLDARANKMDVMQKMREPLLFLIVGAISYAIYVGAFLALRPFFSDLTALTLSFIIAAISNFLLNKMVTFADGSPPRLPQAARYLVVLGLNYCLSTLIAMTLLKINVPSVIALGIGIAATTCTSYIFSRRWIYARR